APLPARPAHARRIPRLAGLCQDPRVERAAVPTWHGPEPARLAGREPAPPDRPEGRRGDGRAVPRPRRRPERPRRRLAFGPARMASQVGPDPEGGPPPGPRRKTHPPRRPARGHAVGGGAPPRPRRRRGPPGAPRRGLNRP